MKTSGNFASFTVGLALILLLTFGILQWLHISVGSFLDWVIAGACFVSISSGMLRKQLLAISYQQ